jgi:hypothetical protein
VSVWYFAYGANMATDVIAGRRGLVVLESRAGRAMGWRVGFVERGLPLVEPAFAGLISDEVLEARSVEAREALERTTTEAWGVLHRVSESDLRRLDRFEGPGYLRRAVAVRDREGDVVEAQAYTSPRPVAGRAPSRRYRDLLLHGAREHGLPESHLGWLRAQPTKYVPGIAETLELVVLAAERLRRRGR